MSTENKSRYKKETSAGQFLIINESNGDNVAVVYDNNNNSASLIESAPNMYKALNEVLKFMTVDTPQSVEAQKKVIAAIRKAEGLE